MLKIDHRVDPEIVPEITLEVVHQINSKNVPKLVHQNITEIPKMSPKLFRNCPPKNQNIVELQGRRNAIDFDRVVSSISKDAKLLMGDPLMDPVQSKPGIRKSF